MKIGNHQNSIGKDLPEIRNVSKKEKNKFDTQILTIKEGNSIRLIESTFNWNKNDMVLPIPSFPHLYFDCAYRLIVPIQKSKDDLFSLFKKNSEVKRIDHPLYNYASLLSSCIINLQASIEAFINLIIPEDYKDGVKDGKNGTKTRIDRDYILRYYSINQKIEIIEKISDFEKSNDEYKKLKKDVESLIKLRNSLIHLKSSHNYKKEKEIMKKLLNFEFTSTIQVVRDFINFIKPDYIVDCNCGNDF